MKTNTDEMDIRDVATPELASHFRKANATLAADNNRLRAMLGERQEMAAGVAAAVVAAPPYKPFVYNSTRKKSASIACLKLSDWHIGEVVSASETEGFGKFNWQIAQELIHSITQDFLKWINTSRASVSIDRLVIFAEGDFISGDIHEELKVTNEFPTPVQTANAGLLLGEVIRALSSHFKSTLVSMVAADNHSRQKKKPQAKEKSLNSFGWLVQVIARQYLAKCARVDFQIAEGMSQVVEVGSYKVLTEHGDTIKGWAGFPYYGFGRRHGREAERRMNTDKGFHFWSLGHFHVPAVINGKWFVNGSLSGTSEFDHGQGREAKPAQVGFLMGPHGVYNWVPFSGSSPSKA